MEQSVVAEGTPEALTKTLSDLPAKREYRMTLEPLLRDARTSQLDSAISRLKSRSPAEKAALRERVLKAIPAATPLPPGKTLEDVISGQWPGDELDEVVFAALEKLS